MPTKVYECDYRNAIIILPNGKNVKFNDRCSNRNGSVYATNDAEEIKSIEEDNLFKNGLIRLIETREDKVEVDKDVKVYENIKTLQEAILILKQECTAQNIEYRGGRQKESVLDCAKSLKISFHNL